MEVRDAILEMISRAGLTRYRVSLDMGRAHSFVNTILERHGGANAATLATIADACGYDLTLQPRGEGEPITIDPTPRPPTPGE